MKIQKFLVLLVTVFSMAALRAQAESINQTIARLNADAKKPGGSDAVLKSISASTHVPAATLAKEKAKSNLSYGELYIAHAIASASGKTFDAIAALKAKGESWDKIANENNVSLGGKKVTQKSAAKSSPTPPQKTLRQEQAERLSGPGY
jgi:hypothetical protein